MSENSQIVTLIRNDTYEIYNFQTVSSFSSNKTSTITTYPTTEGTPHADNIYAQPTTFTISIGIGGNEDITDEWGTGADRPKTALSLLTYLKDKAVNLTIITPQADYTNMFLTGINPNATSTNAYDLSAGLTFSELFISKFETVVVGPFDDAILEANDSQTQNNGSNDGAEEESSTFWDKTLKVVTWLFKPVWWDWFS